MKKENIIYIELLDQSKLKRAAALRTHCSFEHELLDHVENEADPRLAEQIERFRGAVSRLEASIPCEGVIATKMSKWGRWAIGTIYVPDEKAYRLAKAIVQELCDIINDVVTTLKKSRASSIVWLMCDLTMLPVPIARGMRAYAANSGN